MAITDFQPLATRMRPQTLDQYIGQSHLLGEGKALRRIFDQGHFPSMILWGPAGVGKTTLAHLIAERANARVESISAVLAGVKDIREVVKRAEQAQQMLQQATILFVDEVHRFNKAQQDAFLPHVEAGTIILIGATTENPSFQLNNALLSRARVFVLKLLTEADLQQVLQQALQDKQRGLGELNVTLTPEQQQALIRFSDGDARQLLGTLEIVADFAENGVIAEDAFNDVMNNSVRQFDNHGDEFYNQISALHKAVRGTDPDAALYWLARMFDGGCDPIYLARRVLRMASEDIGNADPRGMQIALDAWQAYERLGSPEGELALAQAVVYLACAPKSNATYTAFSAAMHDAKANGSLPVPLRFRNAPTKLMKSLDYGKDYRYAHNEDGAFVKGEKYFPDEMEVTRYYQPVQRGLEIKIAEKLAALREEEVEA